jgi:PAS domain-containing protein
MGTMKQVCAWCGREIGRIASSRHPEHEVSHGICPDCISNFAFQQGGPLQEYLESIELPVFVVDDDVRVVAANRMACRTLGKEAAALQGRRGGDVFECAHARLPEGCGRTIHCSGCAIRRSVTVTFRTGRPQVEVPATLTWSGPDGLSAVALTITTVKVGDMVMLRIDRRA